MSNTHLQRLLRAALETEEIEISCQDCYDMLDSYAEFLLSGTDPEVTMPGVTQHLKQCFCCEHEFEALMIMLNEAANMSTTDE
ncbi:MAG: hypothetical protein H6632_07410 [Anaerolineales bacterium]|nr:hypothetical protein [Anaerolineales bacterium]